MMYINYLYKTYCTLHRIAKKLLRKQSKREYRMVSIHSEDFDEEQKIEINGPYINDIEVDNDQLISKNSLFPIENLVEIGSNVRLRDSYEQRNNSYLSLGVKLQDAIKYWESFLDSSIIPDGYKNSGLHYTGYISDNIHEWCLPSWIWTNAALVRTYCMRGETNKAERIADLFLQQQLECGGWVVRNDYKPTGAIPTLAPNDSAYIANNALIEVYKLTNKVDYLKAAKKCADWIIDTARPDGLVWSGYDVKQKKWIKDYIIVDTGFTAGLFASLFNITKENKYKVFLETFVNRFIELFYNSSEKGFSTSIDINNRHVGGIFARGQAWVLEGLIPAYRVIKTNELKKIIEATISNLLRKQLKNGGWAYNFSRPLLGEDCKGVSVIAKSLIEWYKIEPNEKLMMSGKNALNWCIAHTANNQVCRGGIFSFCAEGAVVHNFYSKTAFVYSSAYAIELYNELTQ